MTQDDDARRRAAHRARMAGEWAASVHNDPHWIARHRQLEAEFAKANPHLVRPRRTTVRAVIERALGVLL